MQSFCSPIGVTIENLLIDAYSVHQLNKNKPFNAVWNHIESLFVTKNVSKSVFIFDDDVFHPITYFIAILSETNLNKNYEFASVMARKTWLLNFLQNCAVGHLADNPEILSLIARLKSLG